MNRANSQNTKSNRFYCNSMIFILFMHYPTTTTLGRNVLASYLQTSLIKTCRQIAHNGDTRKKKSEDRNMSCVFSSMLFDSLAQTFIMLLLPGTPQTNSHPCLIKSSIENVFVERKEIFRAENSSADNPWPFVFPKTAALTPAQIATVFVGLGVDKFISNSFSSPSLILASCKTVVDFFLSDCCKLRVKQRPRS